MILGLVAFSWWVATIAICVSISFLAFILGMFNDIGAGMGHAFGYGGKDTNWTAVKWFVGCAWVIGLLLCLLL